MDGNASLAGDPGLRTPMSWTADAANAGFSSAKPYRALSTNVATHNAAAEIADPNSLYTFYKAMLALRNTRASIATGRYENAMASGSALTFQRTAGGERTLVAINYGAAATTLAVGGLPPNATAGALFPADGSTIAANAGGVAQVALAPRQVRVFAVSP